jgi:hypothetical protein
VFSEIQRNARCPLCRLVCRSLLQNRISSDPLDNERIYYYRMLYGTYDITEIDEFDPDHEYEDLELDDFDEPNSKGKNKIVDLYDVDSDEIDDIEERTGPSQTSFSSSNQVLKSTKQRGKLQADSLPDDIGKELEFHGTNYHSDESNNMEEYNYHYQPTFASSSRVHGVSKQSKKPGKTPRHHESEHLELHASDLDSDEIADLEECTDPSAMRFPATDLVMNGVYKADTLFGRSPRYNISDDSDSDEVDDMEVYETSFNSLLNFNNTGQISKGSYEKGKLPLDQQVRTRIIRKDISRIPKPLGGDITKIRHDLGFWKLYQTSRLHVSTNPLVLDRGGPEIARGIDALEAKVSGDVDVDILLIGDSGDGGKITLENTFLQGRRTGIQLDFSLVRSWVKTCADTHGMTCSPISLPYNQSRRPSRLIDVEKGMVVSAPSQCSYAALSYRWSNGQLMLQQSTYYRLTHPGGVDTQSDDIPLTIRDSILLCRRMSTRYLWVDALCIMQDDSIDKQDQICKMDAIYVGAYFTIVAACGADSRAGLPGVRTGSRKPQRVKVISGITLAAAQPNLANALLDTQWHHRAWTFQEAVLSKRLLIFTDLGVYFQCSTALWCEDTHLEKPSLSEYSINKVEVPKFVKPFWKDVLPTARDFWTYAQLVEDYSPREMTSQTDALNAFTGLINPLERVLDTKFFQGLPIIFFHAALCFVFATRHDNIRRTGFPSWSWSGWNPVDGVDYQDGLFFGEEMCIDCHHFFRLRNSPALGRQLIPIGVEDLDASTRDFYQSPAISNALLNTLTNRELESVLIFEAYKGRLYIDIRNDNNESKIYISRPSTYNASPIGYVGLPPLLRRGRPQYMDFITMCTEEKIPAIESTLLYLVTKDHRGVTYRVNFTCIPAAEWKKVKRSLEVVYML